MNVSYLVAASQRYTLLYTLLWYTGVTACTHYCGILV